MANRRQIEKEKIKRRWKTKLYFKVKHGIYAERITVCGIEGYKIISKFSNGMDGTIVVTDINLLKIILRELRLDAAHMLSKDKKPTERGKDTRLKI